jgi:hypothetical protein
MSCDGADPENGIQPACDKGERGHGLAGGSWSVEGIRTSEQG